MVQPLCVIDMTLHNMNTDWLCGMKIVVKKNDDLKENLNIENDYDDIYRVEFLDIATHTI